jgi:hypothetical protein
VLISVVIPTLGRASLRSAIKSAIEQNIPDSEILVINDSGTMLDDLHEPRVRIIDTPGGLGAAGARQMGVTASGGEFVALLDDDDEWLDGHLENALMVLTAQREVAVYTARVELMTDGARSSISPRVVYRGHISLISFLYGWRAFLGRRRSMPTSTVVARRESVQSTMMDPHLAWCEDIAWLLDLEAKGCRISQSKHCEARKWDDTERNQERMTTRTQLDWANRLNSLRPGAGGRYIALVAGRRLARGGDPDQLRELARGFRASSPMSPAAQLVTFLFTVLAGGIRMVRPRNVVDQGDTKVAGDL